MLRRGIQLPTATSRAKDWRCKMVRGRISETAQARMAKQGTLRNVPEVQHTLVKYIIWTSFNT